jgi:alpha-glucoside transport system substrate-binding protein
VNEKAKIGDWITANKTLDVANVKSPVDKLSVQILQDPNAVFRFDGSDQMPAAVGAGSLWKGMVDWITGKSTADVLSQVEASWPKS